MTRLEELGRVIAQQQSRQQSPRDERRVERFVSSLKQPRWRAKQTLATTAGLVAAAAIALLAFGYWHRAPPGNAAAPLAVGTPLFARDQVLPLNFPDGSQVELASGTEAIVRELHESGATLEVSRGEAAVAVKHRPDTHWLVGAGPFRVRVTGTRFAVAWMPERERFELRLTQGSVVVTSEQGTHAAVTMVAPETLVVDAQGWQLSPPPAASAAPATETPAPETAPAPEPSATPPASAVAPGLSASPAAALPWEELVRAGKYRPAYDEAARRGIAQLADARPSGTLLSLAEACRFSGHTAEAAQVLSRLRTRFPGTDDAATAAFELGRAAGNAGAIGWFRTYLQERPNGALAREASGRLLEALSHSGDREGAKRAAEQYLARYPSGPHAAFARQLLAK